MFLLGYTLPINGYTSGDNIRFDQAKQIVGVIIKVIGMFFYKSNGNVSPGFEFRRTWLRIGFDDKPRR